MKKENNTSRYAENMKTKSRLTANTETTPVEDQQTAHASTLHAREETHATHDIQASYTHDARPSHSLSHDFYGIVGLSIS